VFDTVPLGVSGHLNQILWNLGVGSSGNAIYHKILARTSSRDTSKIGVSRFIRSLYIWLMSNNLDTISAEATSACELPP
jgi:hypothetical protein